MMKICFLSAICLFIISSSSAQSNFKIKGQVDALSDGGTVFLFYTDGLKEYKDSVKAAGHTFSFSGHINSPSKATLIIQIRGNRTFEMEQEVTREFYLDMGLTTLAGKTMKTAQVKGGKTEEEFKLLTRQLAPVEYRSDSTYQIVKVTTDTSLLKNDLIPKMQDIRREENDIKESFVKKHGDSYVSLFILLDKAGVIYPDDFAPLYNSLTDGMKKTPIGKIMGEKLSKAMTLDVGKKAISFTLNDQYGKPVSLSVLKGKYVLLDFWASWCVPCRMQTPDLKKVYENFHTGNFEILAVSIDKDTVAWKKAIKDDALPWLQVCDITGNRAKIPYQIQAVPQNYLIDPSGMIIARNIKGDELMNRLRELVK
jgi:peroxiredoxin